MQFARSKRLSSAFTLIELLVVIAIIALLLGILLPSLQRARNLARQINSSSCVKQLLLAYKFYSSDNDGMLLWGYPPPSVSGKPVQINDSVSGHTFGYPISSRYPWHIVPYLDDVWGVVYSHGKVPEGPTSGDSYNDAFTKAYSLSLMPTFGLNSVYLGGYFHPYYKGFVQQDSTWAPNYGSHVVYKDEDVRKTSQQIVFTESVLISPGSEESESGYHLASSPHANGELWYAENNQIVKTATGDQRPLGLPRGRYSKKTITGFYDGHVDKLTPDELDNMSLWSNKKGGHDYDYTN